MKKTGGASSKPNQEDIIDKQKDSESLDQQDLEKEKKDLQQTKFQSLPLREYYDHAITSVLLEGLRELGKQRFLKIIIFHS